MCRPLLQALCYEPGTEWVEVGDTFSSYGVQRLRTTQGKKAGEAHVLRMLHGPADIFGWEIRAGSLEVAWLDWDLGNCAGLLHGEAERCRNIEAFLFSEVLCTGVWVEEKGRQEL